MVRLLLLVAAVLLALPWTSVAHADEWDLNLGRLCQLKLENGGRLDCGGGYSPTGTPLAKGSTPVVADNAAFRALMSELGVVFAPNILSPSDTQGYGGFDLAVELGWTMVNRKKLSSDPNIPQPHWYWRAAQSVSGTAFKDGDISSDSEAAQQARERIASELPSAFAPTVTVMVRKGLWLPVPSFEMGVGVRHLIGSEMWAPVVSAKLALHEGYQGWPLPELAVRGSGSRVMGTPGFNLTVAGLDFSISKHLGIASTFNLTPYVGYQLLWIVADSEVIDATPGVDAVAETAQASNYDPARMNGCTTGDCKAYFTFANQSDILRHRAFFGLRANFYISSFTVEYSLFTSGGTATDVLNEAAGDIIPVEDDAGTQHSVSFSVAFDY